jgi:uncharacterized protein YceK
MKRVVLALATIGTALLSGCVTVRRGDCEFMLPTERDRCVQANKSSDEALKSRKESKSDGQRPFVMPVKKKDSDSATDDRKP